jgi:hypothetical protein
MLEGLVWSTPRSGRFILENEPVSIVRETGGFEAERDSPENLAAMGFEPRTVHLWTSRYTDNVTPAAKYDVQRAV